LAEDTLFENVLLQLHTWLTG